ncbi:CU044_2847 family protein [Kitasatospora sp. GP82]|uniref:CU044_2847 family protein n=1 Tax=Kitasatospora sp. GP82 TaxID=3035089 RepID=UPI0024751A62|nr:CU044_2847 family protein [Kitasatospora sp. GP82]MDH6126779.1 hypothetical protein [Kitasatospora sp. GP82]
MPEYAEFVTADGAVVRVEGAETGVGVEESYGMQPVGRSSTVVAAGVERAAATFEQALAGVRIAAESALAAFRDGSLKPDAVEIAFGVKLSAEAGALIAKTATDAHLTVKLVWSPERIPAARDES